MLTLPDFKEKQILFIDTRSNEGETKIKFLNDNLVYLKDNQIINRASCHKIFCIFIIGEITITSGIIKNAAKYGISIFFLTTNFKVYSEIGSKGEANFLLRMQQYRLGTDRELKLTKFLVKNKIKNQSRLLGEKINSDINQQINNTDNQDSLRGIEGNYSKVFFKKYFKDIEWSRREPRTKRDINNFLLDIGYTQIFNFIDSMLRLYGFDTYKGVYHKLFFARKSLSCDLIEPFRCIIDKELVKANKLGQINKSDFLFKNGAFILPWHNSFKYSKIFSEAIMNRREEIFNCIKAYYRHVMLEENKLIEFNINKKYKTLNSLEREKKNKHKEQEEINKKLKDKDIPFK